jgi:hypothetical protein
MKYLKKSSIRWTKHAQQEKIDILIYWKKHNGSNVYPIKIKEENKRILLLLKENPFMGDETEDFKNVRRILI